MRLRNFAETCSGTAIRHGDRFDAAAVNILVTRRIVILLLLLLLLRRHC